MAVRPTVGSSAEDVYQGLGPWAWKDTEDERWSLLEMVEAIVGGNRLQLLDDIVRDSEAGPGWSKVLNLELAPEEWLGWLAQFVGVRTRAGLSDAAQRARIAGTDGFRRGTPGALEAAARQYLVGPDGTGESAYVIINERLGGFAYRLGILTLESQTPDEQAVLNAILEQKPAGIVLTFSTVPGQTYEALRTAFDSYQDIKDAYATYDDLRSNLP